MFIEACAQVHESSLSVPVAHEVAKVVNVGCRVIFPLSSKSDLSSLS